MKPLSRRLLIAVMVFACSPAALAGAATGWNGAWSGSWGGSRPTSVTIAHDKVVSYTYEGVSTPVAASRVTPRRVTYEHDGVVVTLTRTGRSTALAKLHSSQGDATAQLKRN